MRNIVLFAAASLALAGCGTLRGEAPKSFIVFFSGQSTQLPADGQSIVKSAAYEIQRKHPQSVLVSAGVTAGDNMELSQPRFDAVRAALVANGVSQDIIARSAIPGPQLTGAGTNKGTATGDQRVEIRLLASGP